MSNNTSLSEVQEPYLTFKQAAKALNIPYFKIQRAAKDSLIPVYRLLNSRLYVKLSDIECLIKASRK